MNGQAIGTVDSWQDVWIEAEGRTGKHANDKCAGGEKGAQIIVLITIVAHCTQASYPDQGEDDAPWTIAEAFKDDRLYPECGDCAQDCERNGDEPGQAGDAPRSLIIRHPLS